MSFDVCVIGGGHNGLTAAGRLALAGRKVVLLERRQVLGGLAAKREFHPGFTAPGILHDTEQVRPEIVDGLGLAQHGLQMVSGDVPVLAAAHEGPGLMVHRDPDKSSELEGVDKDAYNAWRTFLGRVRGFMDGVMNAPPPSITASSTSELFDIGMRGLALRRLGKSDMTELLRVLPMCAQDWLQESFTDQRLMALLATPAVLGTFMGPRSAGSAANLLLGECTARTGGVIGGPGALVDALEKACERAGVAVRTGATVAKICVESGKAVGVELAGGERIDAKTVLATVDPKLAMLGMVPPTALPMRIEDQFDAIRVRGTAAKMHLALSEPLEVQGRKGQLVERLRTAACLDDLERAFDAVKYREMSEHPVLDVRVPTVSSPALAPAGQHVVSILVGFAPRRHTGGWSDEKRAFLGHRILDALAKVCPGVRDKIVGSEVLSPRDIEKETGSTGGHIHHGEHALDQLLMMRPAPCAAQYATPIGGLYLGSSGCHPGGGVTCAPGALAAGAILAAT